MRLSFEGDRDQAQFWLGKSQQELSRLRQRMAAGQLEQGKFFHNLSDSAYVYGGIVNGLEWVHIVTTPGASESSAFELHKPTTPDFISGLSTDARILVSEGDAARLAEFWPTAQSVRMHPKELRSGLNKPARLAVDVGPAHVGLVRPDSPRIADCGYVIPTRYSGKMRAVIQGLLGFGKQQGVKTKDGIASIYDLAKPTLSDEKATNAKPILTRWQKSLASKGLQVWYDFRFARTHGITTAADGKPWLVEISMGRGICAMPLPMWPLTTKPEFLSKVQAIGDTEAETMISELGGFPTGEPFPPIKEEFDAYVRAGRIIQLLPAQGMQEFYSNLMYSSATGWAFNASGSEAHNTAYNYSGQYGIQKGVHYACNIRIGATRDDEGGTPLQKAERKIRRQKLQNQFERFRTSEKYERVFEAVYWKIGHMNDQQLTNVELKAQFSAEQGFIVAKDMQLDPLAGGTATCGKAGEGNIWWPSKYQPQIKYPEPELGAILSHDMRPDASETRHGYITPTFCDTVMWVFFRGNTLVHAKFYYNPDNRVETISTNEDEPCMLIGTWKDASKTGVRGIPAGFYTNEFDDRRLVADSTWESVMTSKDMGWVKVSISDYPWRPSEGEAHRDRGFLVTTNNVTTHGEWWRNSITVPCFEREGYYYAHFFGHAGKVYVSQRGYNTYPDPNYGHYFRHFGGWTNLPGQYPNGCGNLGSDRKVVDLWYDDGLECKDVTDHGQWLQMCQNVEHIAWAADLSGIPRSTSWSDPYTATLHVTYSSSHPTRGQVQAKNETRVGPDVGYWPGGLWFLPSPDPDTGDFQAIHATRNCLGKSDLMWVGTDINRNDHLWQGSPMLIPDKPDLYVPRFVGVIDG